MEAQELDGIIVGGVHVPIGIKQARARIRIRSNIIKEGLDTGIVAASSAFPIATTAVEEASFILLTEEAVSIRIIISICASILCIRTAAITGAIAVAAIIITVVFRDSSLSHCHLHLHQVLVLR